MVTLYSSLFLSRHNFFLPLHGKRHIAAWETHGKEENHNFIFGAIDLSPAKYQQRFACSANKGFLPSAPCVPLQAFA